MISKPNCARLYCSWLAWALAVACASTAHAEAASDRPALRLLQQHTFTGEVRDIYVGEQLVWAATSGGVVVHRRIDGQHLWTLTTADGLVDNSSRFVAPLDKGRLLLGSDFGVALVDVPPVGSMQGDRWSAVRRPQAWAVQRQAVAGARFDPVFDAIAVAGELHLLRAAAGLVPFASLNHTPQGVSGGGFGEPLRSVRGLSP